MCKYMSMGMLLLLNLVSMFTREMSHIIGMEIREYVLMRKLIDNLLSTDSRYQDMLLKKIVAISRQAFLV